MRSDPIFAFAVGVVLIVLVVFSHWLGHRGKATPAATKPPRATREPKPFAGFTRKPECPACEQETGLQPSASAPHAPPPRMIFTRGRRRHVDTTGHFCPHATCSYHGRLGWGNIRANGHPNGRRWRQLMCLGCKRHFLETHGTPFHGKQVDPDKLVWAIAALAEGLGIRAVARVFEIAPNTVLGWLVEAADHLEAFSRHILRDLHVEQVQMDELFALLSAVKAGEITETEAIQRLSRSPQWVWVAMEPVCKLILAVDIAEIGPWPWPNAWSTRSPRCWRRTAPHCFSPMGLASISPPWLPTTASGFTPLATMTKGLSPNRAGCRCPSCSMRRWSSVTGAGVSRGQAPCRLRRGPDHRVGPGQAGSEDQFRLCRASESRFSSACGSDRSAGQHVVQTRSRVAPAIGSLSDLS
jgi:transposase-like protein